MKLSCLLVAACAAGAVLATPVLAADEVKIELSLKDHVFTPSELLVPAGKVVLLTVKNDDPTPEEFDSHDLKVEKVIAGGSQAVVRIGPLDPGHYSFMGEYNEATAHGLVTAQ
jgi:plastocyanin domain-containing protein